MEAASYISWFFLFVPLHPRHLPPLWDYHYYTPEIPVPAAIPVFENVTTFSTSDQHIPHSGAVRAFCLAASASTVLASSSSSTPIYRSAADYLQRVFGGLFLSSDVNETFSADGSITETGYPCQIYPVHCQCVSFIASAWRHGSGTVTLRLCPKLHAAP